jgi:hypothetical protein
MFAFNYLLTILISLMSVNTSVSDAIPVKIYPVPPVNDNSLFYIQRTKNTNAIVYELNKFSDGRINEDDPVKIYWIRYASDSTTDELTMIQRKYAYGLTARIYNGQKNSFVLQFVSYKKRNIYLLPASNGKRYAAFISINGKLAELKKVFICTSGGSFWFPTIDYVELTGKDPSTQQVVVERFHP